MLSPRAARMHGNASNPSMSANLSKSTSNVSNSSQVTLIRPAIWQSSSHATYSVTVQPNVIDGRQRVATASADKAHGVCIWDLQQLTNEADPASENAMTDDVSVKLEGGGSASSGVAPRGLLAVLPHHLSAVNVVRWEPILGARLASGSDLPTQSIIVWKRDDANSKNAADTSTPYGLTAPPPKQSPVVAGGSNSASEAESAPFPNVENWVAQLSLHGQSDITDLAWGPIGLHFRVSDDPHGLGTAAPLGCTMDSAMEISRRISVGLGSQVLASGSLDRSVVVWNVDTGDRHHLKGHTGWVLGVAFDPTGTLLATQSIDGYVWIWSLANFQLVRKVRDVGLSVPPSMGGSIGPKPDVGRTVSMARISWTPDGAALIACRGELKRIRRSSTTHTALLAPGSKSNTHAPIKHVSVALNRKRNFETQAVFGGHAGRTTVSAVNPVLFCAETSSASVAAAGIAAGTPTVASLSYFSVLAIGSHDCVLSLWSTRRATPLLILTEVWSDSILDLSWSADGHTLLVASHDGSIVALRIEQAVFGGRPATKQEQEDRLCTLYGDAHNDGTGLGVDVSGGLVTPVSSSALLASAQGLYDSPAALELQQQQKTAQQRIQQISQQEHLKALALQRLQSDSRKQAQLSERESNGSGTSVLSPIRSTSIPITTQQEVRRADGKRRIIPLSIPSDSIASTATITLGAPVRSTSTSANALSSTASQLANATPAMLMELTGGITAVESNKGPEEAMDLFAGAFAPIPKKRKRPQETDISAGKQKASASASPASSETAIVNSTASITLPSPASPTPRPSVLSDEYLLPTPPRLGRWILSLTQPAANQPFTKHNGVAQLELQTCDFAGKPLSSNPTSGMNAPFIGSEATIVSAYSAASSTAATAIPAQRQQLWQSFVPHRAVLSAGNSHMVALACVETTGNLFYLHLISSSSGRQLCTPLLLTAPPCVLSMRSTGNRLASVLVITCDGLVRVYDLTAVQKKLHVQASVRHLLRPAATTDEHNVTANVSASTQKKRSVPLSIIAARLNSEDAPVLVLSNHSSFVYDRSFECWTLLSAPSVNTFPASDTRSELTVFQRTADQQMVTDHTSTLPAIDSRPTYPTVPLSLLAQMPPRTRVLHTVAQLESELSSALLSGDAGAYRLALTSYVAKLVSFYPALPAASLKLDEVCNELCGPPSSLHADGAAVISSSNPALSNQPPRWQPYVLGLSKRALLNSLMPLLRTNQHLQSLTLKLQQHLNV
jgi:WD40 repeat protein